MRDSWTVLAALAVGSACGCPRNGEPPAQVAAGDSDDGASVAPTAPDAGVAADAPPPPPPVAPLPDSFHFVPQVGHAGPVWAVPLGDGRALGIDSAGQAGWWTGFTLAGPVRQASRRHLPLGGVTAVAYGGPAAAPRVAIGTADGAVYAWRPAPDGAGDDPPLRSAGSLSRAISALAVAPDLERIAAGAVSGTVRMLDADGTVLWTRDRDHGEPIADLAFSPDGARLAGACADGTVTVWSAARGTPLASLPHDGPVTAVAWSPDAARLAAGTATRELRLWAGNPPLEVARRRGFAQAVTRLAFTPDGAGLVAADELGEVHLLDAETLEGAALGDRARFPCTREPRNCFPSREGPLRSLAFDPDNALVLGGADGSIRRLDLAAGLRATSPAAEVVPLSLAATPDGEELVVGLTDGTLVWLGAEDGRERRRARAHDDGVTGLAFDAHGRLLTASLDGTVAVWPKGAAEPSQRLDDHHGPVSCLAVSADGARAATGAVDGAILVWDATDAELRPAANLAGHVSRVLDLAFGDDATLLWSGGLDRAVQQWNLARRRAAWSRPLDLRSAPTRLLAHDGAALVGDADGNLQRIGPGRAAGGTPVRCAGPVADLAPDPERPDAALAACGDGSLLRLTATATADGATWSVDGEPRRLEHDAAAAIVPGRDGRWYVAGESITALDAAGTGVRWRTWFGPGGSTTCTADDRFGVAGDGARWVGYSDGRAVRGAEDPAVALRSLDAADRTAR